VISESKEVNVQSAATGQDKLAGYCLLITGEHVFSTQWLPDNGDLVIGSSADCQIQIEDPSVASRHAVLHLGPSTAIEDLGSAVGTVVGEAKIAPQKSVALTPGELITIGSVMLIFQKRINSRPRRIWTHGYFETRLEEECTRAEMYRKEFALLRIHCEKDLPAGVVEETLANVLRAVDVVGSYGPAEYEVILNEARPAGAELVRNRIISLLGPKDPNLRVGIACYPRDGRSADLLSAFAAAALELAPRPSESAEVAATGVFRLSKAMRHLDQLIERVAVSTINVLLMGETGVGKDVFAERIHRLSLRCNQPLLRLNCASLSESLLESELFGHERGAFTGAVQTKPGLLETADGGTIFLDEIGELPISTQVKLLRVLEERVVLRVGSVKPRSIDVRFVAATNRDLEEEVARGAFRQDLFFRLNGISIVIPPLRERVDEIESLALHFVSEVCGKTGQIPMPVLSREVLNLMKQYAWPGNIRELRNVVERAVLLCNHGSITLEHLPVEKMSAHFAPRRVPALSRVNPRHAEGPAIAERITNGAESSQSLIVPADHPAISRRGLRIPKDLQQEVIAREKQQIIDALSACAGNQTGAAKMLGISRRTLVNRLNYHGISGPRKNRNPLS